MTQAAPSLIAFGYRAQTRDGQSISGTLDARDVEDLNRQLHSLGLRVTEIEPRPRPARARALRGDDFIAFNQQLAHLTGAGMPIEHGLRLIAQDMRRGSLAATANKLADELERGTPLPEALAKFESKFPPLYARLVEAGVKSNNLPAMLLNLGRHVEMVARLRAAMWRAAAYPLSIFIGVLIVLLFISMFILPQLALMYSSMNVPLYPLWSGKGYLDSVPVPGLPWVTNLLLAVGPAVPYVIITLLVLALGSPVIWAMLRLAGLDRMMVDFSTRLPLIGPVVKRNLLARWLDAMHVAVAAGLDLPASISLATDAVGSPSLALDAQQMRSAIESGKPLDSTATRFITPSIPAAIELAAKSSDLAVTLDTLAQMQQQQAEIRLAVLPALLTPILLALVGGLILLVLAGLLLPLFRMLSWMTGGGL